ncbi:MAG: hypothetical protein ABUK01_13565 [Leptospirales bacterium]
MISFSGCGYFLAGTWEDDPDNWERAFGSEKPTFVSIIHSKYWRSPHFTYEFQYFFSFKKNQQFLDVLIRNDLIQVYGKRASEAKKDTRHEAPEWFAPKAANMYRVYILKDADVNWIQYIILIDKNTGTIFMSDISL